MEIIFLGTGAGIPSPLRNVSSLALLLPEYQGETWLFDCGEATQHHILSSPVRLTKITRIWITHLHGDHIYGLPGLLGSRSFQGAETPLTVYGPRGIQTFIETTLQTSYTYLRYPLNIVEIEDHMQITVPPFDVTIRLLEHGIPSYGYRLEEHPQPGTLNAKKLLADGLPPGPLYQSLKRGETITLPDGRTFCGKDYLSTPKLGKIISILGDTRFTEASIQLAEQANLLIHESTYGAGQESLAFQHHHATCTQAAEVALRAGAKSLILNHISSRFTDETATDLITSAQNIFPQTQLAHDGYSYTIY
ncbi:ribonuclease Z [Hazenella sp. IB182357]|uniref:Ribonuclease Z n=1 Tax=Polycladospora coralii TaxID=2771432 RepID=A0A926RV08_9BACL|nr:ribonuclease Z [Polycladospora coralii]MBD1373034.1 ribonuclease Z [Polycladospora coralii]